MDLRMYWISKTAIPEIIIMIFYITAGWTENCTTHQDLDDVPDPEDWTRNGYLGNAGLNITYKKTKLISDNFMLYNDVPKLQIGMDINVLKKMLSHPDIKMLLKKVKEVSKRTLWQVQHNTLEIKKIITAIKKTGEHHWWDIFLNTSLKSPTAAQFFNFLLHPVLVLIFVVLLLTLLNIWLWWKVRTVAQQVHVLWAVNKIMQKNLQ
ncbi:PREDICTED: uncharacterized protein LOC106896683 isoform X2 [Calidris pugnax]|uniref:uncharacterized protein LOC106896683 isoform X2 n=1 Tax=Calidris pugnax TaxID=198806 RepID=UPI00071D1F01|nr:PREDICTED: uncharacterized protein LOC106896683 isoform X2 [Calidris pugnax]